MNPGKRKNENGLPIASSIKKKKVSTNEKEYSPFTSLCEDCIEKIFKYLDVNDMAAVGRVCQLFHEVAVNTFTRQFNGRFSVVQDNRRGSKVERFKGIENVLQTFGPELDCLEASSIDEWRSENRYDKPVLDCIEKYFCRVGYENVKKELQIREFHFDESMVKNVNLLFGRLSKLTLTECKLLDGTDQLFANCENLTKLKLFFVHTNPAVQFQCNGRNRKGKKVRTSDALDPCFNHHFPKLTSFTMQSITTATEVDIDNFLSKNPQLEKLKIVKGPDFDSALESITRHVPNIQKLNIPVKYITRKTDLLGLKQLKKLEFDFNWKTGTIALRALRAMARSDISLEVLKLAKFRESNDFVSSLTHFGTLRQLVLAVHCFSDDKLQILTKRLPAVTQISVI